MNETKRKATTDWFESRIAHFRQLAQALNADDRADEAVFAKVQMNVYDIFSTIFSVALKTCGQSDEKVVQFFMAKVAQIPQNWHASLAEAEKHADSEKAHIERIKLEALEDVIGAFSRIWEVSK